MRRYTIRKAMWYLEQFLPDPDAGLERGLNSSESYWLIWNAGKGNSRLQKLLAAFLTSIHLNGECLGERQSIGSGTTQDR